MACCSVSGGSEGFFEDGLEELGGMGAGVLDFRFQFSARLHQCLVTLNDGGLFGKRRERYR